MRKSEFEELKNLLVKYRDQIKRNYPDDEEGVADIERMIRCVNIELKTYKEEQK